MTTLVLPPSESKVSDAARLADPRREMMVGGALAALLVLGFGGWAATSRLDAAVVGSGVIRMADARQVMQAPNAGIISAVHVTNGQRVREGQVLVDFTTTEAAAQARALAARVFGLEAEIARIQADLRGAGRVDAPALFASLDGEDRALALEALAGEQAQLDAQRALNASESAVLRDRRVQIGHQISGYGQRLESTRRQAKLNKEELEAYRGLLAKGLATKPRVLALERSATGLDGDAGATLAEMARLRSQDGEAQMQLGQLRSERATRNAERLHQAQSELQAALPQWQAARAELQRMSVRAPFAGTVNAAQMPIVGAVSNPGMRLLEVVPDQGNLSVEMRVPLNDAAELRKGQAAQVRLPGNHLTEALSGTVQRVSADSVEDERTGMAFYTATVQVSRAELDRISQLSGRAGGVRAGMPVEVVVPTRQRSALTYMVEPLFTRTLGAFSQR